MVSYKKISETEGFQINENSEKVPGKYVEIFIDPGIELTYLYTDVKEFNISTKEFTDVEKKKTDFTETQTYFIPENDPNNTEAKICSRAAWNHYHYISKLVAEAQTPTVDIADLPTIQALPETQI